jgi:hypothetical protein
MHLLSRYRFVLMAIATVLILRVELAQFARYPDGRRRGPARIPAATVSPGIDNLQARPPKDNL